MGSNGTVIRDQEAACLKYSHIAVAHYTTASFVLLLPFGDPGGPGSTWVNPGGPGLGGPGSDSSWTRAQFQEKYFIALRLHDHCSSLSQHHTGLLMGLEFSPAMGTCQLPPSPCPSPELCTNHFDHNSFSCAQASGCL